MLKFFERQKLVKKGYACNKTRRKQSHSELGQLLETSWLVKVVIFLAFATGLSTLIFWSDNPEPAKNLLVGLLILITAVVQLWINHPQSFASNSRVLLLFSVFFVHLLLIKIPLALGESGSLALSFGQLAFSFAFAPLVLSVLLGKNQGLYAAVFVSLWGSVLLPAIDPVFLVMSLICGFIAVFVTLQVRRRSRLVRAGAWVGVATLILAFAFGRIGPIIWMPLAMTDWQMIGTQCLIAFGSGVLTAMLVGGLLPMLEGLFKVTTDISWLEMADLNHPLLRRLTIEAPGTYHHSLVVANLAESAAEAIGANATMCRVSAYFHDIGKLVKPNYFTENLVPGVNPHDDLAPTMSALIIIAHVKEGVDLGLKHHLNQEIIDIIEQHHGTSSVAYFYNRALQLQQEAKQGGKITKIREEDIPEVKEASFRYPGPRPQTREAAIVSLADSVESASRSIKKPTPQRIEQMIEDIIAARIADHQLDECDLTLRDLRVIAERFRFTLRSMMHSRVAYSKEEDAEEEAGKKEAAAASDVPPPVSVA